jgi:DNA-binding SARP family transcriptional activator/predicted negative regulator of RcsB-dependent stress response
MSLDLYLEAPLRIQLFGGPAIREGGEARPLTPYQSAFLTLVYGHDGQGLSRPRAIWMMWEESDNAVYRQRVRQTLHGIRKRVGRDLIRVVGDTLEPATEGVHSDLRHYHELLASGEFRQAASLHREGFASKLVQAPSREYEDWLEAKRVRLRRLLLEAGARGWDEHHPRGNWPEAREAAEALYAVDPENESVVRKVIEARAMTGSREGVEAAYSALLGALGGERSPGRETIELVERVRTMTSVGWSEERSTPEHIPLVGRADALARARECLDRVRHGTFEVVLVKGEAGIGKTRLLDELKQEAYVKGFRCLSAHPVELEQRIPLNPLLDALGTEDVIAHIDALGEPWRAVIAALLPADAAIERVAEVPYIQESSLSRRLLDAFSLLFSKLADDRPTLLFIDDLQWADATTLAVLQFIQRRWRSGSLGVVASIRPDLVSPTDEVGRYLREPPDLGVTRVSLEDLSEEDAIRLVRNVGGEDVSQTTCARICALGGCNPFYIIELTKDYLAGKLQLPEMPSDALTVPISIQQLFEARIEHLSPAARKAAEVMAVWARWMKLDDLSVLIASNLDTCADHVEELAAWRLVQVDRDRVRIAHELFRSALYQRLGAVRRAVLHRAVAQHLLATSDAPLEGELAVHFARAGDTGTAVRYARKAATEALENGAVAEAAHFLEIVAANEADETLQAEATADLGRLLHMNREIARANPLLELASSRLRKVGRTSRALRIEIRQVDGLAEDGTTPIKKLIERLSLIKKEARAHGDWETVALALDVELHLLARTADIAAIQSLFEQMRRCSVSGSEEAACVADASLALNVLYGDPDEGLGAARAAVRIAEEDDLPQYLFLAQNRLFLVLVSRGMLNLPEGQELIKRAGDVSASSGDLIHRFHFEANVASFHMDAGDLDRAEIELRHALSLIAEAEAALARVVQLTNLAELVLRKGDFLTAARLFTNAEMMLIPTTPEDVHQIVNAGLGIAALETGDLSEARRRWTRSSPSPAVWHYDRSPAVIFRARMMERQGHARECLRDLARLSDGLKGRFTFGWFKLLALEARMARRTGVPTPVDRLLEAIQAAQALCLDWWVREFQELLEQGTRAPNEGRG